MIPESRVENCLIAAGTRALMHVRLPLQASATSLMSLPPSVIVIGLTWPGCARMNASAAASWLPRNGACSFLPSASQGQPPAANVLVDSPGQP